MRKMTPRRTTAFSGQRTGKRFALNRSLLPSPLEYYTGREQMRLVGSGEWCGAKCPFHDDHAPSLRINTRSNALGRFW